MKSGFEFLYTRRELVCNHCHCPSLVWYLYAIIPDAPVFSTKKKTPNFIKRLTHSWKSKPLGKYYLYHIKYSVDRTYIPDERWRRTWGPRGAPDRNRPCCPVRNRSSPATSFPWKPRNFFLPIFVQRFECYLWSMETNARSNLCLLLNITSFCGISSRDGGPKGVQMANSASGGASVLRFWPCRIFSLPRISKR